MPESVRMVVLAVDGVDVNVIHRSVLDRVVEIAGRLGCRHAMALGEPPVHFHGDGLRRLRREVDEINVFAEAARQTGWVLGGLAAAPGDRAVPVLDTSQGMLWVDAVRGFELHGADGARRVTELPDRTGSARRVPLARLIAPLVEAAASGGVLDVYERDRETPGRGGPVRLP